SWAPLGDPHATAIGEGGAHIGEGWITQEIAHGGVYSWRAQVDPSTPQPESHWPAGKSSLERWRITHGERDFTVSAWYYFPTDYPSDVWSLLMQIKEAQNPRNPPAVIAINRDRELLLYNGLTNSNVKVSSTVVPVGRWVQIKTRFVINHNNGRVTTWLDGQLVFDVSGINTLGHSTTRDVYFGVGNYLSGNIVRSHVYIDDIWVTRK
ncbi:MAG: heparin lyase I family protein, partial [Ardenticatenaceae bacterium]